jgi:hypothetical protein
MTTRSEWVEAMAPMLRDYYSDTIAASWVCDRPIPDDANTAATILAAIEPLIREAVAQDIEAEAAASVERSKQYERKGLVTSASVARIKDEFFRDAANIARNGATK